MPPTFTDEGLRAALEARRADRRDCRCSSSRSTSSATYAAELLADGRGGVGYLLKDRVADVARLRRRRPARRRGRHGARPRGRRAARSARPRRRRALDELTPREREVLALMAEGRSNAAIAAELVRHRRARSRSTSRASSGSSACRRAPTTTAACSPSSPGSRTGAPAARAGGVRRRTGIPRSTPAVHCHDRRLRHGNHAVHTDARPQTLDHARKFFIAGEWVEPATPATLEVINPATEQPVTSIALGAEADVDRAVAAARAAFDGYAATSREERLALLGRIVEGYLARKDDLALAVSLEMGAPAGLAAQAQVPAGLGHFAIAIEVLKTFEFEETVGTSTVVSEPVGVCAFITPWNWPLNQIGAKVAPALAAGCTMVLKPSEIAPLSAVIVAEILAEAGVPAGVFNLVQGDGPTVGAALSAHPQVDMVSFTGSTRAGIDVARNAAPTVKRVAQEHGGKSANIVLDDADPQEVIARDVAGMYVNSGQSCNAGTRCSSPPRDGRGDRDRPPRDRGGAVDAHRAGDRRLTRAVQQDPGPASAASRRARRSSSVAPVARRAWDRVLRQADRVRERHQRHDDRARGDLRPRALDHRVRGRRRGGEDRQRHELRARRLRLLGRPRARACRRPAAADRHGPRQRRADHVRRPFGGYKQSGNGREFGAHGLREFLESDRRRGLRA